MSKLPRLISGFTVIPVAYARSTHVLYARAHRSKPGAVTFPERRTLFLVNVPVDATDREIALFFQPCGTVERVVWDRNSSGDTDADGADADADMDADFESDAEAAAAEAPRSPPSQTPQLRPQPKRDKQKAKGKGKGKPADKGDGDKHPPSPPSVVPLPPLRTRTLHKTGALAHVVFLDAASVDKALVLASAPPTPRPWPSSEEPRGLAHYVAVYDAQRPPLDVVKAHADSWMARFEFELEVAEKARKRASAYRKGEAIVDEDGFTLVTRGGAYGRTLGGGVGVASKTFMTAGGSGGGGKKKRKEPKEKEAFYAFQKAEKQRNALLDLRKSFEADKARVEKLKESRRFKPY